MKFDILRDDDLIFEIFLPICMKRDIFMTKFFHAETVQTMWHIFLTCQTAVYAQYKRVGKLSKGKWSLSKFRLFPICKYSLNQSEHRILNR